MKHEVKFLLVLAEQTKPGHTAQESRALKKPLGVFLVKSKKLTRGLREQQATIQFGIWQQSEMKRKLIAIKIGGQVAPADVASTPGNSLKCSAGWQTITASAKKNGVTVTPALGFLLEVMAFPSFGQSFGTARVDSLPLAPESNLIVSMLYLDDKSHSVPSMTQLV